MTKGETSPVVEFIQVTIMGGEWRRCPPPTFNLSLNYDVGVRLITQHLLATRTKRYHRRGIVGRGGKTSFCFGNLVSIIGIFRPTKLLTLETLRLFHIQLRHLSHIPSDCTTKIDYTMQRHSHRLNHAISLSAGERHDTIYYTISHPM